MTCPGGAEAFHQIDKYSLILQIWHQPDVDYPVEICQLMDRIWTLRAMLLFAIEPVERKLVIFDRLDQ